MLDYYNSMTVEETEAACTNKTVCILGNGQSALELAVHLVRKTIATDK